MPESLLDLLRREQDADRESLRRIKATAAEHNRDLSSGEKTRARELEDAMTSRSILMLDAEAADRRSAQAAGADAGTPRPDESGAVPGTQGRGLAYARSRDTYAAERDATGERSYFKDLFDSQRGDVAARSRIAAFENESRATTTSSFAGLVVPQYLVDQAALIARTSRPVANSCHSLPIPDQGMTFYVTKGTTGASAAVQATQNTNVSNTDEVWSDVQVNVQTIAGQQDVSRQSLERGTPGLDQLIFADLAGAYFAAQETQIITGTGTGTKGLQNAGGTQVSAFTAAAAIDTFQSKVAGGVSAVTSNRFLPPTHVAMHPRRWAWLLSLSDSSKRPLVVPSPVGAANPQAIGDASNAYGATGYDFMGLHVVVSAGIPTNVGTASEDLVFVYRAQDVLLWESASGMPNQLRFEQTLGGQLTVKIVAYGYTGFTAERYPLSVAIIGGNAGAGFGLVAPSF